MEDKKTMIANLKFMSNKSKNEAERLMDIHNKVLICLKKGTPKKLLDLVEASRKEGKGISIEDLSKAVDYTMIIPDGFVQFGLTMHLDEVCEAWLSIALRKIPGWEKEEKVDFVLMCKDYELLLDSALTGPLEDQDACRQYFIETVLFRLTCIYGENEVYKS
nr:MAG TPA: hypothetical protein [Caudoviricetes sp.]